MCQKITYQKSAEDIAILRKMRAQLDACVQAFPNNRKRIYQSRVFLYPFLYFALYFLALLFTGSPAGYIVLLACMGISIMLIFLNLLHDAAHDTLSDNRRVNQAVIFLFDLLGGNGYAWKKRHVVFHHGYPNVPGYDTDIEQAGPIRISEGHNFRWFHRYQPMFIFFLYPLYMLNWILLRDFKDFFAGNRVFRKYGKPPRIEYLKLFFFKAFFLFYMLVIPIWAGHSWLVVVTGFIVMTLFASFCAMLVLLTPHVNISNDLPEPGSDARLPHTWLRHQFATTNDLACGNWITRNLLGNFNLHLAHHIFPGLSSMYAGEATRIIREHAAEIGVEYRTYPLRTAFRYHFAHICKYSTAGEYFEETM